MDADATLVITESAAEKAVDVDAILYLAITLAYGSSFFSSSVAATALEDLATADVAMTAVCGLFSFSSSAVEMDADAADPFSILAKTASVVFISTANVSPWTRFQGGIFYLCYAYIFTKIFSVVQEVIYGTKAARTNDTV